MDNIESQHFEERKIVNKDEKPKSLCETIETIETKIKYLWLKFLTPIIIFLSPIILALTLRAYLECYNILNNMTRPVQTVTVSSEGPAAEMYPDSMGQYDILREVYRYDRAVYKHVDREDRFIFYTGRNTGLLLTDKVWSEIWVLMRIVVKFKKWCCWYFLWFFIS